MPHDQVPESAAVPAQGHSRNLVPTTAKKLRHMVHRVHIAVPLAVHRLALLHVVQVGNSADGDVPPPALASFPTLQPSEKGVCGQLLTRQFEENCAQIRNVARMLGDHHDPPSNEGSCHPYRALHWSVGCCFRVI